MYECGKCNYKTNRKFNLDKHLSSEKHKKMLTEKKIYSCGNCGKIYKYYRAYTNHNCPYNISHQYLTERTHNSDKPNNNISEVTCYTDTSANINEDPTMDKNENTPKQDLSLDMKELLNKVLQENQQIKKDLEIAKKTKCQYNFNINTLVLPLPAPAKISKLPYAFLTATS